MGLFSSSQAKPKRPLLRRFSLLAPLLLVGAAAACMAGTFVYYSAIYPDPLSLRPKSKQQPYVRILARDGSVLAERGSDDYVPLDLLPHYVADAVIATEDQRFYDHHGVDPLGMIRAAIINLRSGRTVQGGSTLTQQLAKNLYLSSDRTFARKLEELTLALWLESRLTKADILELYLNRVYLGAGAYGIDAAARRYFRKPASKLTLGEAAMIAGLLKAPSRYSPLANPGVARARARLVLSQMQDAGFITEEEERAAAAEVSRSFERSERAEPAGADYAIEFVMDQLAPAHVAAIASGSEGLVVETTLDPFLQTAAAVSVERHLAADGGKLDVSQAAMVLLDRDGGVLALVGGSSYADAPFDRAVKALRQPGSAFKPFVYLAALESGLTPESVVEDLPLMVGSWSPRNDNGLYLGPMSLRTALAKSVNSVAARLAVRVGPARIAETAHRLGIASPLGRDATLALGTSEVSLLELTGAYNVFANGGYEARPFIIRSVRSLRGEPLLVHQTAARRRLVAPQHVAQMQSMLETALNEGTGRRAALPGQPAAGKTGTSQSFRDAWFVGFTGDLTGGVWAGNDDGRPMHKVVGGSLPALIWRDVMLAARSGRLPAAAIEAVAAAPSLQPHPREAIGEGFIARALTGEAAAIDTGSIETLLGQ